MSPLGRWVRRLSEPDRGATRPTEPHRSGGGRPSGWRGWNVAERAGVVGAVAAVVSVVIALVALPGMGEDDRAADGRRPDPARSTGTPTGPQPTPSGDRSGSPAPVTGTRLADLVPQSGRPNLVALPRQVAGDPAFAGAVVIRCPSNQSDDRERDVTYSLRGRYLDFTATVRPYFPTDDKSRAGAFAVVGTPELDGSVTTRVGGGREGATVSGPLRLTASVERAVTLTLRVTCDEPDGVVALVDARLTAAD